MANEEKKEEVIEVPKDYDQPILEFAHTVQKGESIVTCRLDLREPLKQVGQKVGCPGCGNVYPVVQAQ